MKKPGHIVVKWGAAVLAAAAIAVFLCSAFYYLRYPNYNKYRKGLDLSVKEAFASLGRPNAGRERMMALSLLSADRKWDEMDDLLLPDDKQVLLTYYYNLRNAEAGVMADKLMQYYQPFDIGLFLPVNDKSSKFAIISSGDVWFELGDMTMAEHSAILGMAFSPKHEGPRFFKRMAEINLITGDNDAAMKYLRLLLARPSTRKWAMERIPGQQTAQVSEWIAQKRAFVPTRDTLHYGTDARASLRNLVACNPGNKMAREYLLCYDLLIKDLESFYREYDPALSHSRLYDEAILIYLASHDMINQQTVDRYGITADVGQDFGEFSRIYAANGGKGTALTERFGKTYWYFYRYAVRNDKK